MKQHLSWTLQFCSSISSSNSLAIRRIPLFLLLCMFLSLLSCLQKLFKVSKILLFHLGPGWCPHDSVLLVD